MIPKLVINKHTKAKEHTKEDILQEKAKVLTEKLKLQGDALREKVEELKSKS